MEITASKDMRDNWKCENDIELGGDRILRISTHKVHSGALVTTATGHKRVGDGALQHIFSMGMDSAEDDFRKTLASSKVKCTSKAVATQHGEAMKLVSALVSDATAHYAAQAARVSA